MRSVIFSLPAGFYHSFPRRSSGDGNMEKEKTLAMIKPDGLSGNYSNVIKEIILDSGFSINKEKIIQLDEVTVKRFYAEHSSKDFFPHLVQYMTSGPVLIMVLEKVNAVADWRTMIGPTDAHKAKLLILIVLEPCVGRIHKETVFMVQTPISLLQGRYHFSLKTHLQELFQGMMSCKWLTLGEKLHA